MRRQSGNEPLPKAGAGRAALAAFNRRWDERLAQFRCYAGPPWWAPGLVIDAELRDRYERYLPVARYLADLADLAGRVLPDPTWAPRLLRHGRAACACCAPPPPVPALPDLWALLPDALAGQVTLAESALFPFLCALADPPRFGTDFGRYPEQLQAIAEFAGTAVVNRPLRLLDLGCGTGQGTLEAAAAVAKSANRLPFAVGITSEPLEVWMATRRRLPHDPGREARLQAYPGAVPVQFLTGDAAAVPCRAQFDLILADGLVGGPFLRTPQPLERFFRELDRLLAPGGRVGLANRFHEGELPAVTAAAGLARQLGWRVTGEPRHLWLARA